MKDWQVYAANGSQVPGEGTNWEDAFAGGIPHGAAHVWLWKQEDDQTYLLFQKTAPKVEYKAGLLDISAAGHVDYGEDEIAAAVRETEEELGVNIKPGDLYFAGIEHYQRKTEDSHKDEFRFVYTIEYNADMTFTFPDGEVDGIEWVKASKPEDIVARDDFEERFVQHTSFYFDIVFSGVNGQKLVNSRLSNPA